MNELIAILPTIVGMVLVALGMMVPLKSRLKELKELADVLVKSVDDNNITAEEVKEIIKEAKDVISPPTPEEE